MSDLSPEQLKAIAVDAENWRKLQADVEKGEAIVLRHYRDRDHYFAFRPEGQDYKAPAYWKSEFPIPGPAVIPMPPPVKQGRRGK